MKGGLTQASISKISSYSLRNQTLFSKTSAMGVTSKQRNELGLEGGAKDAIAVLNNGANQVAFAEQMATLKGIPGMENLAVLEVTNEITIVTLDENKISSIEKRIEMKKQILLLSKNSPSDKEYSGVEDIVVEDNSIPRTDQATLKDLTPSQVNFVQSTIDNNKLISDGKDANSKANLIDKAFDKKADDAKNAKYKENKSIMIREK